MYIINSGIVAAARGHEKGAFDEHCEEEEKERRSVKQGVAAAAELHT